MTQMKKCFTKSLLFVVIVFLLFGWVNYVQSKDDYPNRAIEIIPPVPPGGAQDLTSRIVAAYLSKKWNVPVNVVNKPGGNSIPGSLFVQNAEPNGYTVLNFSPSSSSYQAAGIKDLPYNIYDRTFLGLTNVFQHVFIVPSNSPFKTLKDVIGDLRKDPRNFTWTSGGGVNSIDVAMRRLLKAINISANQTRPVLTQAGVTHVTLTAGGNVKLGVASTGASLPAIKSGAVRGIAITGKDRLSAVPDMPTFTELGFPTVTGDLWVGFSGPPKMPPYIVEKWDKTFQEMVKDPEVLSKLAKIYTAPFYRNADQTMEIVRKEYEEVLTLWK